MKTTKYQLVYKAPGKDWQKTSQVFKYQDRAEAEAAKARINLPDYEWEVRVK